MLQFFNVENTQRTNVTIRTILCRQFHGIRYCLPVGTQPAHQPRAASKHRGRQHNCAAHCQNPAQHPPRPRLNNRCTSPWPKESPSVPAEGAVDKGERDERRQAGKSTAPGLSSWSCNQVRIRLNLALASELRNYQGPSWCYGPR